MATNMLARNIRLHLEDRAPGAAAHVLRPARVPSAPVRIAQQLAFKAGRIDWNERWLSPLLAARADAGLGSGPPRFLVRVDEFPDSSSLDEPERGGLGAATAFHEIMRAAGVAYLIAIVPQLTHAPLDPNATGGRPLGSQEIAFLEQMRSDGVAFAQHGTTHRSRYRSPQRRSELVGMPVAEAERLLDRGRATLASLGIHPRIFVPPFNRFAATQWQALSERYDVICGGPESVRLLGWQAGPLWRDGAVYLPCYPPLYGRAQDVLRPAAELIRLAPGTWIPIVLHVVWELEDDFAGLRALAEQIAPYAVSWEEFMAALDRSRTEPAARLTASPPPDATVG